MTLLKAIEDFDFERKNNVPQETKIKWLNELDKKIYCEILADRGYPEFIGYDANPDEDVNLLAPTEFEEIYTIYLNMKLDFLNGEIQRYNNSAQIFNIRFYEMADFINRKAPVKKKTKIKAGELYV